MEDSGKENLGLHERCVLGKGPQEAELALLVGIGISFTVMASVLVAVRRDVFVQGGIRAQGQVLSMMVQGGELRQVKKAEIENQDEPTHGLCPYSRKMDCLLFHSHRFRRIELRPAA